MWFAILVSLFITLSAEDDLRPTFAENDSFPLVNLEGEPSALVGGCVNVITGDFVNMSNDYMLPGSLPLNVERSYSSSDRTKGYLSVGWHLNLGGVIKWANLDETILGWKGANGRELLFLREKHGPFHIYPKMLKKGVTNNASGIICSATNIKNYEVRKNTPDKNSFTICRGDGAEFIFKYDEDAGAYYDLTSEIKPNKMAIQYRYHSGYLKDVAITNPQGQKRQSLTFIYEELKNEDKNYLIKILGNDGRQVKYTLRRVKFKVGMQKRYRFHIKEVEKPDQSKEVYEYRKILNHERVTKKVLANNRYTSVSYYEGEDDDGRGRVASIQMPLDTDTSPCRFYKFKYFLSKDRRKGGHCEVFDAHNFKTTYLWNDDNRLAKISRFTKEGCLYNEDTLFWCTDKQNIGNLKSRLYTCSGENLFCRVYNYDKFGNIIEDTLFGNITGLSSTPLLVNKEGIPIANGTESYTKEYTYSEDGKLLLEMKDGNKVKKYAYHSENSQPASILTYDNGKIALRQFFAYDEDCNVALEITDNGSMLNCDELIGATYRKIRYTISTTTIPYGLPSIVEDYCYNFDTGKEMLEKRVVNFYNISGNKIRQDHYGSDSLIAFSLFWEYNAQGKVIHETDAMGHTIKRDYDANGNLIFEIGPNHEFYSLFLYDFCNRLICKKEVHPERTISTNYKYNRLGQKIEEIDPFGNSTCFDYDEFGRLVKTTYPTVINQYNEVLNPTSYRSYDGMGNVIAKIDENGKVSYAQYNIRSQPHKIVYSDGSVEYFVYYLNGQLLAKVERNGCSTKFIRDNEDRIIKKEFYNPNGTLLWSTTAAYDAFHLLEETDAMGHVTKYAYDCFGRKISVTKGDFSEVYEYDSLGRLSKKTTCSSIVRNYSYDFLNRIIQESLENDRGIVSILTNYSYDSLGHCVQTVTYGEDGIPQINTSVYNSYGQICEAFDSNGNIIRSNMIFDYCNSLGQTVPVQETIDSQGIITRTYKDARQREVKYETINPFGNTIQKQELFYDPCGNLCKTTEIIFAPDGEESRQITTLCKYDGMNKMIALIEAYNTNDQKITSYIYNTAGQLLQIVKPSGQIIQHAYHSDGTLARFSSDQFYYQYTYDASQRLIESCDLVAGKGFQRIYDENDHLIEEKQDEFIIQYTFDRLGRKKSIKLPDLSEIYYKYEGFYLTAISKISATGQELYQHTYNERDYAGNILEQSLVGNAGKLECSYDLKNQLSRAKTNFTEEVYSYDERGNLLRKESSDFSGNTTCNYGYDHLYQLSSESGFATHSYSHDSVYNRCSKDEIQYNLNNLNQILSQGNKTYTYDADGNLLSNNDLKYSYDAIGRLISSVRDGIATTYAYDCLNRRISKTTNNKTTRFLYDDQDEIGAFENGVLVELRILGEGFGSEIGAAVAIEIGNIPYAPIHDLNGNVISLIDLKGQLFESYHYSAFGEETIFNADGDVQSSSINPWRFSSKRFDSETNLIYFGCRYYDPSLGRWTTQDPLGYSAGVNLYAYVSNRPLTHFDLYGLFEEFKYSFQDYGLYENFIAPAINLAIKPFSLFAPLPEKSSNDNLSLPEKADERVTLINGINTSKNKVNFSATLISEMCGNRNIYFTHNASFGPVDIFECLLNLFGLSTDPVKLLHQQWDDFFQKSSPDSMLLHICHSQGAIHTRNALLSYPESLRKRIFVVAIAPAAYIYSSTCANVVHYRTKSWWRDIIPRIDVLGSIREQCTISELSSHPNASWMDHNFDSPTYKRVLRTHIDTYINTNGKNI